jgi:hypothetical protein
LGKGCLFLCLFLFSCINTVFFSLIEISLLQYCLDIVHFVIYTGELLLIY